MEEQETLEQILEKVMIQFTEVKEYLPKVEEIKYDQLEGNYELKKNMKKAIIQKFNPGYDGFGVSMNDQRLILEAGGMDKFEAAMFKIYETGLEVICYLMMESFNAMMKRKLSNNTIEIEYNDSFSVEIPTLKAA